MNSMIVVFFIVGLTTTYSSVVPLGVGIGLVGPGNPGAFIKGPAAKATLVGPDGSIVTGAVDAGAVAAAPIPGGVVTAALDPQIIAAPAIGHGLGLGVGHVGTGGLGLGGLGLGHGGALIAGPSGTVVTNNGLGLGLGLGLGHGLGHGLIL